MDSYDKKVLNTAGIRRPSRMRYGQYLVTPSFAPQRQPLDALGILGGIFDPTGVDDHDVGRIPVAVLIRPIIETPSIVDVSLRELHILAVRRDMHTPRFHLGQFLARLYLPR